MNTVFFCLLLSGGVCLWRLWKLHWIENVVENNTFIENLISNIYAILARGYTFRIMQKEEKSDFGREKKQINNSRCVREYSGLTENLDLQ